MPNPQSANRLSTRARKKKAQGIVHCRKHMNDATGISWDPAKCSTDDDCPYCSVTDWFFEATTLLSRINHVLGHALNEAGAVAVAQGLLKTYFEYSQSYLNDGAKHFRADMTEAEAHVSTLPGLPALSTRRGRAG